MMRKFPYELAEKNMSQIDNVNFVFASFQWIFYKLWKRENERALQLKAKLLFVSSLGSAVAIFLWSGHLYRFPHSISHSIFFLFLFKINKYEWIDRFHVYYKELFGQWYLFQFVD